MNLIVDQILQMAIVFGSIRGATYLKIDAPENLNQLRLIFATATIAYYSFCLIIRQIVNGKNDPTVLEYEEPVNGQEEPNFVKTTVGKYDQDQIFTMIKGSATSTAIILVLHLWFKISQPLIIQSVLPLFTLLRSPLFGIHILGMSTTGSFARPWVNRSAFGNALNQPTPVTAETEPVPAAKEVKDAKESKETKKPKSEKQ
ncbi:hypothetical protein BB559_000845 [Furculomyces boomerangus]|uniref:Inorganic phosphate transporter n=2 Tax=Harpellales TaxID=61421 RepID=A0A2T9Z3W1_9FUNG|nr:hypothetical protein BB559_000845 [Furculomyces boomerangus]PWA03404.1 hypothetical protein BB558_000455 [Smittium angustum]